MSDGFSTILYPAGGGTASTLFVADVNGDGRPDVIVREGISNAGGTQDVQVDVLLGDGAGHLLPPLAFDLGSSTGNLGSPGVPTVLGVTDVTGDGRPDVLAAVNEPDGTTQIEVAANVGAGSFAAPVVTATLPASFTPGLVQDVTGDGMPDLVGLAGNGVGVAPGLGNGAFGPVRSTSVSAPLFGASRVFVLPTGTPGLPDLVTFGQSLGLPSGTLSVLDNSGSGSFTVSQTFTSTITAQSATIISDDSGLAIADVNGDGLPDLIEEGRGSYNASPEFLEVFLNNGAGGLGAPMGTVNPAGTASPVGFGVVPRGLTVADVTGDGQPDIVLTLSSGLLVLPNTGGGTFGPGTFSATGTSTPYTLQAVDLAGNGISDLIGIDPQHAEVVVETPMIPEAACFATGTRILTARGQVPVEALQVGDAVMALLGQELATVRWTGHRRLRPRAHPRPDLVQPVRILAGAFGQGRPRRDLRVSPGHALLVDGALVPAELLVNGASVVQEDVDAVTYWHVELDRHDVLLAEGLPAESFLDVGNRGAFEGGTVRALHPDFLADPLAADPAPACAPVLREGPGLAAIRERLLRRACEAMGFATTAEPGLTLLADDRVVPAAMAEGIRHRFVVPTGSQVLRLCSRRWVPRQMLPQGDDARRLGVCVRGLWIDGQRIDLAELAGRRGWHAPEGDAEQGSWCWTDGDAVLPAGGVVEVELGGMMLAWVHAPAPAAGGGARALAG